MSNQDSSVNYKLYHFVLHNRWPLLQVSIVIILISIFYFTITSDDRVVGFLSDDAIYLILAELYSPWHSSSSPVFELIREENYFPPLYPFLMGLMGVNTNTPVLASAITVCFLLCAIFIFGLWVWRETGNHYIAILLASLFAFFPSSLLLAQELWSEFLFMCFLYGTFLYLGKTELNSRNCLIAALLAGFASITRSIGLSLIIAFSLLLFIKRPNRFISNIVISVMPFLLWFFYKNILSGNESYFNTFLESLYIFSIPDFIFNISEKLLVIVNGMYWLFSVTDNVFIPRFITFIIQVYLAVLFLFAFIPRLKDFRLDAIFLIIYIAIILAWPYSDLYFISRFMYPLLPLIIFYLWSGADLLSSKYNLRFSFYIFLLLSVVVSAYPATRQSIVRSYTDMGEELNAYRRNRFWLLTTDSEEAKKILISRKHLIEALPLVQSYVPEDECIYALQIPIVMLYTKRISNTFPSSPDGTFTHRVSGCRYYLGMPITGINKNYPAYYPIDHTINNDLFENIPIISSKYPDGPPVYFIIKYK